MIEHSHSRSQHGEDLLVAEWFGYKRGGYFVEVGALDGESYSNTFLLEHELGWTGVLVEANPVQAAVCQKKRPGAITVAKAVTSPSMAGMLLDFNVVDGYQALSTVNMTDFTRDLISLMNQAQEGELSVRTVKVESTTLDSALGAANTPSDIDFMSIDIEGHELEALHGFSLGERWCPKILLIENNGVLPNLPISLLLARCGYGYVRTVGGINDWYEPRTKVRIVGCMAVQWCRSLPKIVQFVVRRGLGSIGLLGLARNLRNRLKDGTAP